MPVLLSSWAEWNFYYFLCLVVVAVGAVAAVGGRVRGQAFRVWPGFPYTLAIYSYCTEATVRYSSYNVLMRCIVASNQSKTLYFPYGWMI